MLLKLRVDTLGVNYRCGSTQYVEEGTLVTGRVGEEGVEGTTKSSCFESS